MNFYKKLLFLIICFFLLNAVIIFSDEYTNKKFGYFVDIPYGWKIIDASNPDIISFSNANGSAVFQVFTFKNTAYDNPGEMLNYFKNKLKASGDTESFIFSENDSILADLSFETDLFKARGYFIFIKQEMSILLLFI